MGEQWRCDQPDSQASVKKPDEVAIEDRPRPQEEFRSYSLDLLAVLEE